MKYNVKRHAVIQPLDPTIRLIPLTKNLNTIVDAADYEWLMQWNWYARLNVEEQAYYALHKEGGKSLHLHHLLLGLHYDDKRQGDHVNHNTLDNRRCNLRIATPSQNTMNRRKQSNNTSGYKGVFVNGKKWMAQIRANRAHFYLGTYDTKEEAYAVYCQAARQLHGEFANFD